MFEFTDVEKIYGDDPALGGVSLTIPEGDFLAVIGPSGAGKTTLLHLMGGILRPDAGLVRIQGIPSHELSPGRELSRKVGVMHQQFDLVDRLPVIQNVLAGCLGEWNFWKSFWSLLSPREKERAMQALERLGIADKWNERTADLSGGEQQRVALARLLVQQPRAILADEPVASVDPARAEDLLERLIDIAREGERTLVVSLHSVDLALQYFPRIIGLRGGRLLFDRACEDVEPENLERLYRLEETANRPSSLSSAVG